MDEQAARGLGELAAELVHELSRYIDLSALDGVTFAGDYPQALADLDRGYETSHVLTPSDNLVVGIAMTPSVLRDGILKSHIVLNTSVAAHILDPEDDLYELALHTIFHECAHVQITSAFDRCFPGILLRQRRFDLREHCRWEVIMACWDEYAATRISARFGSDPTDGYEETFIKALETTHSASNSAIRKYRLHGDHGRIVREVYGEYGNLLKFSAYHLGNLDGRGIELEDRQKSVAALKGHWFFPFFDRLQHGLRELFDAFGDWPNTASFEAIGDIAEDVVEAGGVFLKSIGDGNIDIKIPHHPNTMP